MEWTSIVDRAYDADITVGAETSTTTITVTIQLKDFAGNNLTIPASILAYTASDVAGLTYSITTVSTDTVAATGSLAVLIAKGAYVLTSTATGAIVLTVTDTAANSFYLVLVMPNGKLVVSDVITFVQN